MNDWIGGEMKTSRVMKKTMPIKSEKKSKQQVDYIACKQQTEKTILYTENTKNNIRERYKYNKNNNHNKKK